MEVNDEIYKQMKTEFDAKLTELFNRKNIKKPLLTKEIYMETIAKLKSESDNQYLRCKYDTISSEGIERIIEPLNKDKTIKYYVHMDEIFQIIYDTHLQNSHCGRKLLEQQINLKYKNITREYVKIFSLLCHFCQQKRRHRLERVKVGSFDSQFPRCQVNIIDMQAKQDGPYKYILVYEDFRTKFVQLRPIKTHGVEEIAVVLLKIFTIFGAPSILHSDSGREFAKDIINELSQQWNELKMVHGQSKDNSLNTKVLKLLEVWMEKHGKTNWSKCLRYVQLMKNRCHHDGLNFTPYKAMFGSKCKVGISSSYLPSNALDSIYSEEDLKQYVKEPVFSKIKMEEETNMDAESMDSDYFEDFLITLKREHESEDEESVNTTETEKMSPAKIVKLYQTE